MEERKVDANNYRDLIGNLFCLTSSMPNIMFASSLLSRFMNGQSHIHLGPTKKVLRYIQGTWNYGIKYGNKIEAMLVCLCDSE